MPFQQATRRNQFWVSQFDHPTIGWPGRTPTKNIDDVRESPVLGIVRRLAATGIGGVLASDAYVTEGSTEFVIDPIDRVIAVEGVIVLGADVAKRSQEGYA